jgi:hypothetical protein
MNHRNLAKAAETVCSPLHHYKWLRESEEYRNAFDDVCLSIADEAEAFAFEFAVQGELIQVGFDYKTGTRIMQRKRDPRLLVFLLKRAESIFKRLTQAKPPTRLATA